MEKQAIKEEWRSKEDVWHIESKLQNADINCRSWAEKAPGAFQGAPV